MCCSRISMSQPAAPSHEALPETFATKQDAIAAIKVLANTTGHRVMQSNRGSKIVTLRCWGYKTHGASSFGCAFKVSYFTPTVNGVTISTWQLTKGQQSWQHTCSQAGAPSMAAHLCPPASLPVLTPSHAVALASKDHHTVQCRPHHPLHHAPSQVQHRATPQPMQGSTDMQAGAIVTMQTHLTGPLSNHSSAPRSHRAPFDDIVGGWLPADDASHYAMQHYPAHNLDPGTVPMRRDMDADDARWRRRHPCTNSPVEAASSTRSNWDPLGFCEMYEGDADGNALTAQEHALARLNMYVCARLRICVSIGRLKCMCPTHSRQSRLSAEGSSEGGTMSRCTWWLQMARCRWPDAPDYH